MKTDTINKDYELIKAELITMCKKSHTPIKGYEDMINSTAESWHALMIKNKLSVEEFLTVMKATKNEDFNALKKRRLEGK